MASNAQDTLPLPAFDRALELRELLAGINTERLAAALRQLLGAPFALCAVNGECLVGEALDTAICRVPLRAELETVGYLLVQQEDDAPAAATLIELLLQGAARYQMASTLHLHAVNDDYARLQAQHSALLESEARYKELAATLEQRVAEQLRTIEHTRLQLYQAEKMAAVGQLAAGVAHEINNPIGFINSNLVTAQSYVSDLAEVVECIAQGAAAADISAVMQRKDLVFVLNDFQKLLTESSSGAQRIAAIVRNLKGFANIDGSDEEVADLNGIVRGVCNIVLREITRHAGLQLQLADGLPATRCRPAHLGQALLNMLLNAGKAITGQGTITVTTALDDGRLRLQIADSGVGISAEVLPRIFDPFFTTADVGSGTGLGLTVSRDIITAHGGDITVHSTPGQGTVFTILLPVRD
ncbi:MAG: two-component sensor histidine kinase [Gammaproteobacteria bacterium]|nr:two-component sensor histidine kinase [Gammaproteobacteria bacterium]